MAAGIVVGHIIPIESVEGNEESDIGGGSI